MKVGQRCFIFSFCVTRLVFCSSPGYVCKVETFPLPSSAYKEKMKEISVLSLICSCLYSESRKNILGEFEGRRKPKYSLIWQMNLQLKVFCVCRHGHQATKQAGLGSGLWGHSEAAVSGVWSGSLHHQSPEEGHFPGGHPEETGGSRGQEESEFLSFCLQPHTQNTHETSWNYCFFSCKSLPMHLIYIVS